jgi:hypothetical protein
MAESGQKTVFFQTARAESFRQREGTRAMKAAVKAGLPVDRVEFDPVTGKIIVIIGEPGEPETGGDLDSWLKKKGQKTECASG